MQNTLLTKRRLMIADEHAVTRQMTAQILAAEGVYDVVGEAANGHAALRRCALCKPDLLILELLLPELSGKEVLRRIRSEMPRVKVLIFSSTANACLIVETLRCHPHGYVEKRESLSIFLEALRVVASGKSYFSALPSTLLPEARTRISFKLTPREEEVLQLVTESRTSKEIANRLGLARKTVENHRARVMEKLHLHDVAALTRYAMKSGIIS
jgi:DNA-binding NarL/FixJ family response regulator